MVVYSLKSQNHIWIQYVWKIWIKNYTKFGGKLQIYTGEELLTVQALCCWWWIDETVSKLWWWWCCCIPIKMNLHAKPRHTLQLRVHDRDQHQEKKSRCRWDANDTPLRRWIAVRNIPFFPLLLLLLLAHWWSWRGQWWTRTGSWRGKSMVMEHLSSCSTSAFLHNF